MPQASPSSSPFMAKAHVAGNEFAIVNASHRVAEILELVGLDRILISQDAEKVFALPPGRKLLRDAGRVTTSAAHLGFFCLETQTGD